MGLGAILAAARLFFGGVLEWLLKAASAAFKWLLEDPWRGLALVAVAALAWAHLITLPSVVSERDFARTDAQGNLEGWIAERNAHAQSITNWRDAANKALDEAEANTRRVQAEERAINERNVRDYQTRLADLRARYDALDRLRRGREAADIRPGSSGADPTGVSGARAVPARIVAAADDRRLSEPAAPEASNVECPPGRVCLTLEQAWLASVQALQLDQLITTILERQAVQYTPPSELGEAETDGP